MHARVVDFPALPWQNNESSVPYGVPYRRAEAGSVGDVLGYAWQMPSAVVPYTVNAL